MLKGYIIVKKQGDRTFHLTCLSENYSAVGANNNSCTDSTQGPGLDLSTYMIQTKQPQVKLYSNLSEFPNFLEIFGFFFGVKLLTVMFCFDYLISVSQNKCLAFLSLTFALNCFVLQEADRLFEAISSCVSQDRRENLPPVKT